jgi:Activator of Hsp90 ATPase homolog 1-like protein
MNDATLLTDRARPAVRFERHLSDPPAVVWQALTDPEQLRSWFPSDVIVGGGRWEVGAATHLSVRAGGQARIEPAPASWQPRFEHYAAAFEPTLGPQDGPPARHTGGNARAAAADVITEEQQ